MFTTISLLFLFVLFVIIFLFKFNKRRFPNGLKSAKVKNVHFNERKKKSNSCNHRIEAVHFIKKALLFSSFHTNLKRGINFL